MAKPFCSGTRKDTIAPGRHQVAPLHKHLTGSYDLLSVHLKSVHLGPPANVTVKIIQLLRHFSTPRTSRHRQCRARSRDRGPRNSTNQSICSGQPPGDHAGPVKARFCGQLIQPSCQNLFRIPAADSRDRLKWTGSHNGSPTTPLGSRASHGSRSLLRMLP